MPPPPTHGLLTRIRYVQAPLDLGGPSGLKGDELVIWAALVAHCRAGKEAAVTRHQLAYALGRPAGDLDSITGLTKRMAAKGLIQVRRQHVREIRQTRNTYRPLRTVCRGDGRRYVELPIAALDAVSRADLKPVEVLALYVWLGHAGRGRRTEASLHEVAAQYGVSPRAASRHRRRLADLGLLRRQLEGRSGRTAITSTDPASATSPDPASPTTRDPASPTSLHPVSPENVDTGPGFTPVIGTGSTHVARPGSLVTYSHPPTPDSASNDQLVVVMRELEIKLDIKFCGDERTDLLAMIASKLDGGSWSTIEMRHRIQRNHQRPPQMSSPFGVARKWLAGFPDRGPSAQKGLARREFVAAEQAADGSRRHAAAEIEREAGANLETWNSATEEQRQKALTKAQKAVPPDIKGPVRSRLVSSWARHHLAREASDTPTARTGACSHAAQAV